MAPLLSGLPFQAPFVADYSTDIGGYFSWDGVPDGISTERPSGVVTQQSLQPSRSDTNQYREVEIGRDTVIGRAHRSTQPIIVDAFV